MMQPLPSIDQVPRWVREARPVWKEATVEGAHWFTNEHIALRLTDKPKKQDADLQAFMATLQGGPPFVPGPPKLCATREHVASWKGLGSEAIHYAVPMARDTWMAACYYALVEHLYGEVAWSGQDWLHAPILAKRGDVLVAVAMRIVWKEA